jgi:hypothetical protein
VDLDVCVEAPSPADFRHFDAGDPMPSPNISANDQRAAYTELCHQFLEAMIEMGQQKIIKPISTEERSCRKLAPRLEEEVCRTPFNVGMTKDWIKEALRSAGGQARFEALCSGYSPYEVARLFMTVVTLAGTGDVALEGSVQGRPHAGFIVRLTGPVASPGSDSGAE